MWPVDQSFPGFSGGRVIVTGGTRGIGACLGGVPAAGAQVLVCGRNDADSLPAAEGRTAAFTRADVRDPEQVRQLIVAAMDLFGGVDVVISNAGGSPPAAAATASPRFHARIIELNLIAPLHVAQAANEVMQDQPDGGSIIVIGSVSGTRPSPGTAAYGAAKAACITWSPASPSNGAPRSGLTPWCPASWPQNPPVTTTATRTAWPPSPPPCRCAGWPPRTTWRTRAFSWRRPGLGSAAGWVV